MPEPRVARIKQDLHDLDPWSLSENGRLVTAIATVMDRELQLIEDQLPPKSPWRVVNGMVERLKYCAVYVAPSCEGCGTKLTRGRLCARCAD